MSNNDLAIRFTEVNYATKKEVSKELNLSLIDGVWAKILAYRSGFYHYLSIKGVDKNQLRVCLCPTIQKKADSAQNKLIHLLNEYNKLDSVNGDAQYFELSNLIKSLQNIALKNNLRCDEEFIRNTIHGDNSERHLVNYLNALRFVQKHYSRPIDVDYLAELYSLVTGNTELTSFYRQIDFEDINSSAVISRVYKCAPHQLIESMMDALFAFLAKTDLNIIDRAIITFYYVEFVKPFKEYNDEIATLLMKSVLANDNYGECAFFIPFEALLNENINEVNRLFYEVQLTSDVTYFLSFALEAFEHLIEKLLDSLAEYSAQIIKNDFFKEDEEKVEQTVPSVEPVKEEREETPTEVIQQTPFVEENREEKVEEPVQEVKDIENKPSGLAINYIPEELDEKTASRLEKHLLELDIRLKKGQAYFYARHCTLGCYYTIDQYKKATKCVYETARTSMEKLVEYGYYVKKEFGKKFVYTPVDRKRGQ